LRGSRFTIFVTVVAILLASLYALGSYNDHRARLPKGVTLGGVPVGGLLPDEATHTLESAYYASMAVRYVDEELAVSPRDLGLRLKSQEMVTTACQEHETAGYWDGFWDYLLDEPGPPIDYPLQASYDEEMVRLWLERVAEEFDQSLQQPHPVVETLSYSLGQPESRLDIPASLSRLTAALTSPANREVELVVHTRQPSPPSIALLKDMIEARLSDFPGLGGVFIRDPITGETVRSDADVAFAGMSALKIAIVEEVFRVLDDEPDAETTRLISETMTLSGNYTANLLLRVIGGGDSFRGVRMLTESMRNLGLVNTFMAAPYDVEEAPARIVTPANSRTDKNTEPDLYMQTTPEDIGLLLEMIYHCAHGGGNLLAAYYDELTAGECQAILDFMASNKVGSFLEAGTPPGVPIAHKHGWIGDSHADIGLVFSPGGDYIFSVFLYRPGWLEWELSSETMADLARATYNYFNAEWTGNE
jgi:beta-lactamase class A